MEKDQRILELEEMVKSKDESIAKLTKTNKSLTAEKVKLTQEVAEAADLKKNLEISKFENLALSKGASKELTEKLMKHVGILDEASLGELLELSIPAKVEPAVDPVEEPVVEPVVEPIEEPAIDPVVVPTFVQPGNAEPAGLEQEPFITADDLDGITIY